MSSEGRVCETCGGVERENNIRTITSSVSSLRRLTIIKWEQRFKTTEEELAGWLRVNRYLL